MIRINLAPTGTRKRGGGISLPMPSFNLGLLFLVVYVAALGGIGWYWWSISAEETRLQSEVVRQQKELTRLKTAIGETAKVKEELAELQKRVDAIQALAKGRQKPVVLLDAFVEAVPRDLWITGFEEKASVLKVSGSAFSTTAVSDFMANLRSSGKFKDVDIVVSRQDLTKTPRLVTFEVTCRFEG